MSAYELLRPGRAKSKQQLLDVAQTFPSNLQAPTHVASFVEEAAEVYERRGLFTQRF